MDLEITRVGRHIALWRLSRPRHNAFGGTLLRDLIEASRAAQQDDDIRVVITTGAGPSYAVGADIDNLTEMSKLSLNRSFHRPPSGGENGYNSSSALVEAMEEYGIGHWALEWLRLDKPLIAAINGPAAGGGFCLALLHDLRVMAPDTFLTPGFSSLGLAPELGASWLLPRLVGQSKATELLLFNPRIGAEEGLRTGLVHRVAQDPVEEAVSMAEQLCTQSPLAIAATLRLLRSSGDHPLSEQLAHEYRLQRTLWESAEFRDEVAKLAARFSGRATER